MNSVVAKSIVLDGDKTSISMEDQLWVALKEIAAERELTLAELITSVDYGRGEVCTLSSALSTLVLRRLV